MIPIGWFVGPPSENLREMLKSRAESADVAFQAAQAAFEVDAVKFIELADATKKLAEAELAVATNPEQEFAALRKYVERTRQEEAKIKLLYEMGTQSAQAKEYHSAKRERESAEIWLLKTRIQAKQ